MVMLVADAESLPAAGAVAQLATLDAAIVAVEVVIEDQGTRPFVTTVPLSDTASLFGAANGLGALGLWMKRRRRAISV